MNTTYTFISKTENKGVETTSTTMTNEVGLAEIIDQFTLFLKGCGFYFHSLEVHADDPDVTQKEP